MLENRKDGIGSILEGLHHLKKIDESGTAFSGKIASFISKLMPKEKKFVEKSLELLLKELDKTLGGYIEGSRVSTRSQGSSKILAWKVQGKAYVGGTHPERILSSACKSLGLEVMSVPIDGNQYYSIVMGMNAGDSGRDSFSVRKFRQQQDQYIIIGLDELYTKAQRVDKDSDGNIYRIIVQIPEEVSKVDVDNPFLDSSGTILQNKMVRITYDAPKKSISWADIENPYAGLRCSTESKRGVPEAWAEMLDIFGEDTLMKDIDDIVRSYKIKIFSYYPMD